MVQTSSDTTGRRGSGVTPVWSSKRGLILIGGAAVVLVSLGLAVASEWDAMLAWWIAIALLLPPLLWALKTQHVTLITICAITFATQFTTVPFFYVNRDNFHWGHVKPFGFTAWEAFPILAKVALFLVALAAFFNWFYPIRIVGGSLRKLRSTRIVLDGKNTDLRFELAPRQNSVLYVTLILFIVVALVQFILWMFSKGISIVGVEPPNLPYRLSGILHYFTHYIVPLLLAYLYWKTKRNAFPMLVLLAYAWVLGLSSTSRSALVLVMLPVLAFAWLDQRFFMLLLAGVGTLAGFQIVTLARGFIQIIAFGEVGVVTDIGIGTIVLDIISDPDSPLRRFDFALQVFIAVFSRVDGFENLVMSQHYDPYQVVGPFGFMLRMISRGLAPMDIDAHHLQWQGNTLPEGWFNGGALLSKAVIVGNAGIWWIVMGAAGAALTLGVLEKSTARLWLLFTPPALVGAGGLGIMWIIYFC